MKNHKFLSLFAITSSLLMTSCNNDDDAIAVILDTEKPTITLNDPVDDEVIAPGSDIHFDAVFTDNVELASYKVDIHDASDGHTHGRGLADETTNPWSHNQSWQIEAGLKTKSVHHHIAVPTTVNGKPIKEGHYHLGVFCIDKAGNEQKLFIEIAIGEGGHGHDHNHDHNKTNS